MKKQVLTAAIGVALIVPFAAQAAMTVYGKLNLGVAKIDNGNDADSSTIGVTDDASRLGVKGDEDLGDGLKVIYQFELSIDADNGGYAGNSSSSSTTTCQPIPGPLPATPTCATTTTTTTTTPGRDVYAGLQGGFGTIRLGQFNSAYKTLSTGLELFGDTIGDFTSHNAGAGNTALAGESRLANLISYTSPDLGGFKASLESSRGEQGTDLESNPTVFAASYKGGPFYIGVGQYDADNQAATGLEKALKVATSIALGDFTAIVVYEKQDAVNSLNEVKTGHVGASYKFGKSTLAATYTQYDSDIAERDADQIAVGFFQELSKNTIVKFVYTKLNNEDLSNSQGRINGSNASLGLGATTAGNDPTGFQTQLSLAF